MFLNISLKSKGKLLFITFTITIVILIISIFLMISIINKTKNGKILNDKLDLTFSNYYTQYDMTVISNKNINTYNVKEWHKEGVVTKLEYLDYMKNIVTITLQNGSCNISNNGNTAKLVINNMSGNKNIASLSTFGYIYNLKHEGCNCSKTQHVKEDEITIKIDMKSDCMCECSKFSKELGVSSLQLVIVNNIPKNYIVYDKNKKEYISIVYNMFKKDIEI